VEKLVSKLGGEEVKRFHWSSHSTSTREFQRGWEKSQIGQS